MRLRKGLYLELPMLELLKSGIRRHGTGSDGHHPRSDLRSGWGEQHFSGIGRSQSDKPLISQTPISRAFLSTSDPAFLPIFSVFNR